MERTLSIIKPDITSANLIGLVNSKIEQHGLKIIAQKMLLLTESQVKLFYALHKDKPFFLDLVTFMISGPVVVQILEGKNAVAKNREIMGDTNPQKARNGTIRKEFSNSIEANSVHGSDSIENAQKEIAFFFSGLEILG